MSSSGATSASGAADYVPSSIDAKSFDIEEVMIGLRCIYVLFTQRDFIHVYAVVACI